MKRPEFLDIYSIPNPAEIDAINALLDTLLDMLIDGDLNHDPIRAAFVEESFALLGVEAFDAGGSRLPEECPACTLPLADGEIVCPECGFDTSRP